MTYHPEHAGVIPENTLGLDDYNMLEYRFYLHRDEFRERMYEAEPGQISFSGATWDPSEGYFVMDTGWDLHQGFTNSEMVDRIDELVAEGTMARPRNGRSWRRCSTRSTTSTARGPTISFRR